MAGCLVERNSPPRRSKRSTPKPSQNSASKSNVHHHHRPPVDTQSCVAVLVPQIRQQVVKMDVVEEVELFPMPKGMTSGSEWKAVAERLSRGPAAARDPPAAPAASADTGTGTTFGTDFCPGQNARGDFLGTRKKITIQRRSARRRPFRCSRSFFRQPTRKRRCSAPKRFAERRQRTRRI